MPGLLPQEALIISLTHKDVQSHTVYTQTGLVRGCLYQKMDEDNQQALLQRLARHKVLALPCCSIFRANRQSINYFSNQLNTFRNDCGLSEKDLIKRTYNHKLHLGCMNVDGFFFPMLLLFYYTMLGANLYL